MYGYLAGSWPHAFDGGLEPDDLRSDEVKNRALFQFEHLGMPFSAELADMISPGGSRAQVPHQVRYLLEDEICGFVLNELANRAGMHYAPEFAVIELDDIDAVLGGIRDFCRNVINELQNTFWLSYYHWVAPARAILHCLMAQFRGDQKAFKERWKDQFKFRGFHSRCCNPNSESCGALQ